MKVLIVRYSAIGDCVMTAWMASSIRQAEPDAKIVWAVQPRCSAVVSRELARIEVVPRDRRGGRKASLGEMLRWHLGLRREKFDIGFDVQGHSKTAVCLRLARPKLRFSVEGTDPLVNLLNPASPIPSDLLHKVEREHALACAWRSLPLATEAVMPRFAKPAEGRFATIQTGAGAKDKRYPAEMWAEVAGRLAAKGLRVLALGAPGDPEVPGVESLVGKLSLEETLAWVQASALHLAADTGTGHAAAAYGVPVVSVFGPMPVEIYRPWGPRAVALWRGASPASVSPQEVVAAAEELLG